MKKRIFESRLVYMTLLETLIAMTLLSLLLVFVFGFFRQFSVTNQAVEQVERQSFQIRYIEVRLGFIFERIVNEKARDRDFYFYTEPSSNRYVTSQSLVFTFNNEPRLDPLFSSDVLGKLYVDDQKRLILAIWPLFSDHPKETMKEEVLAYGVQQVKYAFYFPPEPVNDTKDIQNKNHDPEKKTPERDVWHEEWLPSYDQMPVIIKMSITFENPSHPLQKNSSKKEQTTLTEDFYFVLPSSKNPVNYPEIKEIKESPNPVK